MLEISIIKYSDEVAGLLKHKCMLRISSWGRKFYVDYDKFLEKLFWNSIVSVDVTL